MAHDKVCGICKPNNCLVEVDTKENTDAVKARVDTLETEVDGKANSSHSHDAATTSKAGFMSTSDKTKLNGIATGAEVNQNAFSNITVGSTTIAADAKTDTLTLVAGSNVTITPDATNDKITIASTNTTYGAATTSTAGLMSAADKTKLDGVATGANKYSHPTSAGNKHIPSGGSSGQILRWSADGTAAWGADNNTTYSAATTSAAGLMSAADKTKLDGITASADTVSISRNLTSGTKVGTITINGTGTDLYCQTNSDTKNTAGSTNSSSKLFLVGATSQAANPQTYSHDTAYVGTDGCLYSNSTKVSVEGHTHGYAPTAHATTATTYGIGTSSNYGHVKLSDSVSSTSAASAGIAASPKAVKTVADRVTALESGGDIAVNASSTNNNGVIGTYTVSHNPQSVTGSNETITITDVTTTMKKGFKVNELNEVQVTFNVTVHNSNSDYSGLNTTVDAYKNNIKLSSQTIMISRSSDHVFSFPMDVFKEDKVHFVKVNSGQWTDDQLNITNVSVSPNSGNLYIS